MRIYKKENPCQNLQVLMIEYDESLRLHRRHLPVRVQYGF
ncbi:hypothetical protein LA635_0753 [Erwinia amylovora LA635]|nr:hypothetical protein LA635_0753 [Erwinia amylovora LA635]CDK17744.1 hypothetical protein LA636_0752 [Erwinia amylovora LA636]CDK21113.1 hypothetical protein LA637_0753 [Erwinia amylovora LA637]